MDDHMTNASKPHVLCDAQNLIIDPAQTRPAACPKYRPKYLCNFGATYNHYMHGAFELACNSDAIKLEDFPRDHLQDIMESIANVPPDTAAAAAAAAAQVNHCLRLLLKYELASVT